ncbi:hypothetical protein C8J57DRAFT_1727150, partial [Mycena rebaudengoi]
MFVPTSRSTTTIEDANAETLDISPSYHLRSILGSGQQLRFLRAFLATPPSPPLSALLDHLIRVPNDRRPRAILQHTFQLKIWDPARPPFRQSRATRAQPYPASQRAVLPSLVVVAGWTSLGISIEGNGCVLGIYGARRPHVRTLRLEKRWSTYVRQLSVPSVLVPYLDTFWPVNSAILRPSAHPPFRHSTPPVVSLATARFVVVIVAAGQISRGRCNEGIGLVLGGYRTPVTLLPLHTPWPTAPLLRPSKVLAVAHFRMVMPLTVTRRSYTLQGFIFGFHAFENGGPSTHAHCRPALRSHRYLWTRSRESTPSYHFVQGNPWSAVHFCKKIPSTMEENYQSFSLHLSVTVRPSPIILFLLRPRINGNIVRCGASNHSFGSITVRHYMHSFHIFRIFGTNLLVPAPVRPTFAPVELESLARLPPCIPGPAAPLLRPSKPLTGHHLRVVVCPIIDAIFAFCDLVHLRPRDIGCVGM